MRPTQKTTNVNGIDTLFTQNVCPTPSGAGDSVAQSNGLPLRDGMKGTTGQLDQVTTVSVKDADGGMKIPGS